jgi:hypothetical protein
MEGEEEEATYPFCVEAHANIVRNIGVERKYF